MARSVRKAGPKVVPLAEAKDDLSRYLREAATQEILITRHGKPADPEKFKGVYRLRMPMEGESVSPSQDVAD